MNNYKLMSRQLKGFLEITKVPVTVLSNAVAILFEGMDDINWCGFYLARGDNLLLGPFQGKPACCLIPKGKGVCGTAFAENRVQLVPDVHAFPGHIACDCASNSEIVLPLVKNGCFLGVLDIDSPKPGRFTVADQEGLEEFCQVILSADWTDGLL